MAVSREDFEIFVQLLGVPEMQAEARRGAQAISREWAGTLNDEVAFGGGDLFNLKAQEVKLAAFLSNAQDRMKLARANLANLLKDSEIARSGQEILSREVPLTKKGLPNKNVERSNQAEFNRLRAVDDEGDLDALIAMRRELVRATGEAVGIQGTINRNAEKLAQAEWEASDAGKDAAAAAKLAAATAKGHAAQVAEQYKARLKAEADAVRAAEREAKEIAAATAKRLGQRDRAEAKESLYEYNARRNPLTDPLSEYQKPLAEGTHEPERSQVALVKAQSEVEQTLRKIKTIWEASAKGELDEIQAKDKMAAARRQLTSAMQRETVAQERLDSEAGGFIGQFKRGFKGASDRPYAEQLGQAVKFSAFYGAAYRIQFALLTTFKDALQEGIAFEQGLSDMALATGRSKSSLGELGDSLALLASNAGTSPSAGVEIGARAMGLYGLAESSDHGMQDYVARLSADVVSKLALGSKVDPVTLQQNLAAITQATGLGAAGQIRVADLDAFLSKRFGVESGSTLESGAQSASVGISAGFSLEQIQAAAALMISRTGQSSSAVGGYLAQIFSRGGEGSLTGVAQKYGIDTAGRSLADVFADLAQKYKTSGRSVQNEIAAAFGRGKVQNAVVSLLQDFKEVGKAAKEAQDGKAGGALNRAFDQRVNNIGGAVTLLGGHFKELALMIGESGLLSGLGLLIVVTDKIVTVLSAALRAFDELPGPLRTVAGLLLALAAAERLGLAGAIGKSAIGTRVGVAALDVRAAAQMGGAVSGIKAAGAMAMKSVGPWAVAIAGLYAIGALHDSAKRIKIAIADTEAAYRNPDQPGIGGTAAAYRTRGDELDAQAKKDRDATGWLHNAITFGQANNYPMKLADALEVEAKRVREIAKRVEAEADNVPLISKTFASLDEAGLKAGLDAITASGGNAITRLSELRKAIWGLSDAAAKAKGIIHPDEVASELGKGLDKALKGGKVEAYGYGKDGNTYKLDPNSTIGQATHGADAGDYTGQVREQLSNTEVQKRLAAALKEHGVSSLSDLDPKMLDEVANEVMQLDFNKKGGKHNRSLGSQLTKAGQKKLQELVRQNFVDTMQAAIDDFNTVYSGDGALSVSEGVALTDHIVQASKDRGTYRSKTDYAGRARDAKKTIRDLKHIQDRTPENMPENARAVRAAEEELVQVSLDRFDAIRKTAIAYAGDNQGKKNKANRAYVRSAVQEILTKNGTRDQLAAVIESAGKGAILIARKMIDDTITLAKAAAAAEAALGTGVANATVAEHALSDIAKGGSISPQTMSDLKGLKEQTYLSPPDTSGSGSAADKKDKPTAEEVRASRLAAEAARKGGDIASARAAVASALADLHKAKKGTVEYYNALASFYSAKEQLNEAMRSYRHILGELRIDNTDPVAEAQLALVEARRKLRQDRGKGVDVRAQDRLDVKNAQTSLESEKFNQRLSDVQTAEQLGRISHAAYMQYLDSEHNRLSAISHRTRQQQDELNQIDQLMKDAAGEMQGAFNIGDIKLPTPYEVRRYIKSAVVSTPYALGAGATGGTTTIYINGADTGAVTRIINDTVGKGTRVLTTTTRRN